VSDTLQEKADRQLDIALFTDTFDEVNGVAKTFNRFADFAASRNIFLEIFAPGEKELFSENEKSVTERIGTVRIHRYRSRVPIKIYTDLRLDLKVVRNRIVLYCGQAGFDVIHTATPGSMGLTALYAAHHYRIPLVGSYHTSLPAYVQRHVQKLAGKLETSGRRSEEATWKVMRWYYDHCRIVLAPSEFTKRELEAELRGPDLGIFSRGIDTARFNPVHRSDELRKENDIQVPLALYVGRVSIEKDLDILVECFRDNEDTRLVVVGDGPYLPAMREALPDALFLGFRKGQELSRIYASCDFFVFPSTTDTFGNVVLEAMASRLPVIVSDAGGPRELVEDGSNGFVTSARDAADFLEKVQSLARDKEEREKMAGHALAYAQSRSWDAVFEDLISVYERYAGG
jgi:glycosyltransferase involved in cell wall biosynthesis